MRRMRWLMLAFLALMAIMAWERQGGGARDNRVATPSTQDAPATLPPAPRAETPRTEALPPEVDETLARIAAGGPFPHDRDGLVFGNFEGRLPPRERGWYREYTVPTPGLSHRGARRIVTGGNPPGEYWYTDDHYESFRSIGGGK